MISRLSRTLSLWALGLAWAALGGASSAHAVDLETAWQGLPFDDKAFAEVVELASSMHLQTTVPARAWTEAAAGALRATGEAHLFPADFLLSPLPASQLEILAQGRSEPLPCPGVARAAVIWRPGAVQPSGEPLTRAAYRERNLQRHVLAQDGKNAWGDTPFGAVGLRCAMAKALPAVAVPGDPTATAVEQARVWRLAAVGFVSALDPHCNLLPSRLFEQQESDARRLEVVDVGIDFVEQDQRFLVRRVHPDLHLPKTGPQRGDELVNIDGKPAAQLTLTQLTKTLQGQPNTSIVLQFRRGTAKPFSVTLQRQPLHYPSVSSYLPADVKDIGVIRLPQFASGAAADVLAAVRELQTDADGHLLGLILDMRGNTGGWVQQGVAVAELFLRQGVILQARLRKGADEVVRVGQGAGQLSLPTVVLVDAGCMSACELVTAALQDQDRVIVVGQNTFGKGTVQEVRSATRGPWSLIVTIAQYLSPLGRSLQVNGITPEFAIAAPADAPQVAVEATLAGHLPPATTVPNHVSSLVNPALRACVSAAVQGPATSARDNQLRTAIAVARCLGARIAEKPI